MNSRQKASSNITLTNSVNTIRARKPRLPLALLDFRFVDLFFEDEREEGFLFALLLDAEEEAFRVVFVVLVAMRQACSYCSVLVVWSQTSLGPKY